MSKRLARLMPDEIEPANVIEARSSCARAKELRDASRSIRKAIVRSTRGAIFATSLRTMTALAHTFMPIDDLKRLVKEHQV